MHHLAAISNLQKKLPGLRPLLLLAIYLHHLPEHFPSSELPCPPALPPKNTINTSFFQHPISLKTRETAKPYTVTPISLFQLLSIPSGIPKRPRSLRSLPPPWARSGSRTPPRRPRRCCLRPGWRRPGPRGGRRESGDGKRVFRLFFLGRGFEKEALLSYGAGLERTLLFHFTKPKISKKYDQFSFDLSWPSMPRNYLTQLLFMKSSPEVDSRVVASGGLWVAESHMAGAPFALFPAAFLVICHPLQ